MESIPFLPTQACDHDLISLGEVMLRFDPGERRIDTTRNFSVSEGGAEYNVARAMRRCFKKRTAIVTALADNPVGRLVEDLILQGGVDMRYVHWAKADSVGNTRVGLNFVERGFGARAPRSCSDRAHTAISQAPVEAFDWETIFKGGSQFFVTGGVFSALSESTHQIALAGVAAAKKAGAVVCYDLNYRPSLFVDRGGQERAQELNASIMPYVDVLFGDFGSGLGVTGNGDPNYAELSQEEHRARLLSLRSRFSNLKVICNTTRVAHSATAHDWGAVGLFFDTFVSVKMQTVQVLDRVGSGDAFASGVLYGLLNAKSPENCLRLGLAHGAHVMSTPGDTSMAELSELERIMNMRRADIAR